MVAYFKPSGDPVRPGHEVWSSGAGTREPSHPGRRCSGSPMRGTRGSWGSKPWSAMPRGTARTTSSCRRRPAAAEPAATGGSSIWRRQRSVWAKSLCDAPGGPARRSRRYRAQRGGLRPRRSPLLSERVPNDRPGLRGWSRIREGQRAVHACLSRAGRASSLSQTSLVGCARLGSQRCRGARVRYAPWRASSSRVGTPSTAPRSTRTRPSLRPRVRSTPPSRPTTGRPWKASTTASSTIAFVDGVRRVDARLTLDDPVAGPMPGLCGTFAVGATRWERPAASLRGHRRAHRAVGGAGRRPRGADAARGRSKPAYDDDHDARPTIRGRSMHGAAHAGCAAPRARPPRRSPPTASSSPTGRSTTSTAQPRSAT